MSAKSFEDITYEVAGHTATITLNRPNALNALSPDMITELRAAYDEAENDDNVWLLIVTGTGRSFCSLAAARAPGVCEGSGRAVMPLTTWSQPSSAIWGTAARIRRNWASSAGAGTGRSRARLRRRHSAGLVSNSTATAGRPLSLASAR